MPTTDALAGSIRSTDILADWDGVHHDVGVGDTGSNFCLGDDAVFVRTGARCLKIDLQTGHKIAEFKTPVDDDARRSQLGLRGLRRRPAVRIGAERRAHGQPALPDIRLRTESVLLFAMDADTGQAPLEVRSRALDSQQRHRDRRRPGVPDRSPTGAGRSHHATSAQRQASPAAAARRASRRDTRRAGRRQRRAFVWKNDQEIWGTQLAVSSQSRRRC